MTQLKKNRAVASARQEWNCCYCQRPMWDGDAATIRQFCREHVLTKRQAFLRRCTAEHLVAQGDGGTCGRKNIAAACAYCNRQRHRRKSSLSPEAFRVRVLRRLQLGKWSA